MENARPRPLPAFEVSPSLSSLPSRRFPTAWTAVGTALVLLLLATPRAPAQEKESIFDRVVHLEDSLFTAIPQVPRLEEALGLEGRRIRVGDAELWVEEEGAGVPLVLIHGGPGGTHHGFHPWFGRAAEFARVIYYDQRGCGLSDYEPGPDGYSVEQAVEDLEGLRRVLGVDTFVLVGFSYGGFLAQYYTTRYPENVAGLVLVGASPGISADLGRSREQEFISDEERGKMREIRDQLRALAPERGWSGAESMALLVYNNHVNGDWKRQHYYKPSPERMAQIALYEWVQDDIFNGRMSQSAGRVDLTGAFDQSPVPTLILEGDWDLTWGPEKREALAENQPHARMITFERAGHSIFSEDPDRFFPALRDFVLGLEPVDDEALSRFRTDLDVWREAWMASVLYHVRGVSWGMEASRTMAAAYRPDWLRQLDGRWDFLRLGLALYDVTRYEDAREVFAQFEVWSREQGSESLVALAAIWQGHMLDLLGRRSEAVALYQEVAAMDVQDTWSQDQYGLRYTLSPYAAERVNTPFTRIENQMR
jgi:proline-specific peptidase